MMLPFRSKSSRRVARRALFLAVASLAACTVAAPPDVAVDGDRSDANDAAGEVFDVASDSSDVGFDGRADSEGGSSDANFADVDAAAHDHGSGGDGGGTDALFDAVADESITDGSTDGGARPTRTINYCNPASPSVMDFTAATDIVVIAGSSGDYRFEPGCIRIRRGQRVTFRLEVGTTWGTHPLEAGEMDPSLFTVTPDPSSPIPTVFTGTADVVVTFTDPGSYGYHCSRHFLAGMVGAVHVVP